MSIEAKIDELIAALDRNTAAQGGAAAETPASGKGGRKPKATATESAAQPAATTTAASAPAATVTTPPATPAVPIEKVNEAILKLAKENRDKAVAVLAKFGVQRSPELKPDQYQAVIDEAEEQLAKVQAAAAQQSLV